MSDFFIESSVCSTTPIPDDNYYLIYRGASANFEFSLDGRIYEYSDIKQLTVLFRQDETLYTYNMFSTVGGTRVIDSHFYYNSSYNTISFAWSSAETDALELTPMDDLIAFEIVVTLPTDASHPDIVQIEPQRPVCVIDSLYHGRPQNVVLG